ncbi:hypothetical protein BABINDRAFT_159289 [Babjeviella inositovora NRRL Y-12698]|uniref:Uncharacterized protein n=1 Tax=Babjeviella inositovora NRRL Y-12698 TaxID=984486 RepID=A0A1E3QYT0_9ASCO|nr:uncharacterized protein BABINDRAFT_159289 [Babjeviella inositovora NRRL Y-12698]ODQ82781.1 hypothetical protein BABINDRAFT_159289 [Babjeviella inositovora NRRL Y-12698]
MINAKATFPTVSAEGKVTSHGIRLCHTFGVNICGVSTSRLNGIPSKSLCYVLLSNDPRNN